MGNKEPAAKRKPAGICRPCGKSFTARGISRHLAACRKRETQEAGTSGLLLSVESPTKTYWMHLEIPDSLTLEQLDSFLRRIWLAESCGHLSQFIMGDQYYCQDLLPEDSIFDEDPEEENLEEEDLDLRITVAEAVQPRQEFRYEYDMGDTTALLLKAGEKTLVQPGITILARNNPPEMNCLECGKPGEWVCPPCGEETNYQRGMYCEECSRKHECSQGCLLPVVNSPRMGVCGYEGETSHDADPWPDIPEPRIDQG